MSKQGQTEYQGTAATALALEEPAYRWVILAAAFMMMLASAGMSQAFSLFVKPMAIDFGGARGTISMAYTVYMVVFWRGIVSHDVACRPREHATVAGHRRRELFGRRHPRRPGGLVWGHCMLPSACSTVLQWGVWLVASPMPWRSGLQPARAWHSASCWPAWAWGCLPAR